MGGIYQVTHNYFPLGCWLYRVRLQHLNVMKIFVAGRPGSSEVSRNPLTCWDVSSIPANGIFLTKKLKNKNKNDQRVENN